MNTIINSTGVSTPMAKEKIVAMLQKAETIDDTLRGTPEGGAGTNAAEAVKAAVAGKAERMKSPFVVLGETRGGSAFVMYSVKTNKIDELKLTDLRGDKLLTRASLEEIAWWTHPQDMEADPAWAEKHEKEVMATARRMLLEMIRKAGPYNPERVRANGIWQEVIGGKTGVIYNAGKGCYFMRYGDGKLQEVSNNQEEHLYDNRVETLMPVEKVLTTEEGRVLSEFLGARTWEVSGDYYGMLMTGWVVNSMLAGMVKRRPHLWVTGPAAMGKTTLHDDVLSILGFRDGEGNGLGVRLEGSGTTEAGTRQEIDSRVLPVVFDELENNEAYKVDKNIEGILNLMRTAYSSLTGIISKGGEDGKARAYMIRCGFLCFSVYSKLNRDTDYTRCLELRMVQLPDAERKAIWKQQEEGRRMIKKKDFTGRLIYTAMQRAQVVQRFEEELEEHLKNTQGIKVDDRKAELFAHLLAGYFALVKEGEELSGDDKGKAMECIRAYAATEEVSSEFDECLATLLGYSTWVCRQKRTVRQLCRMSLYATGVDFRMSAEERLESLGLAWVSHNAKLCLRVRLRETALSDEVFCGTRWKGNLRLVLGVGCKDDGKPNEHGVMYSSARFGVKTEKVLFLPKELILPEEDEAGEG